VTANQFRRLALGLEGVVEAEHMNHPDFRVGGKIFASLQPGLKKGMVSLSPEEQARFTQDAPTVFEPVAGAWGRGGATSGEGNAKACRSKTGKGDTARYGRGNACSHGSSPDREA